MPTTREYFRNEAREILERLDLVLRGSSEQLVDSDELRAQGRALRGSAQLAREERVRVLAHALEIAARNVGAGRLGWTAEVRQCALDTLDLANRLAANEAEDPHVDAPVADLLARWRGFGIEPPVRTDPGGSAAGPARPPPDRPAPGAPEPNEPAPTDFLRFVAGELAGILSTLEAALPSLARDPRDREPLKAILRRQRVLFGAVHLDRVPAVAEALQTIDVVTRLIARLDTAVTGYWLEVYRSARDVLAAVIGPLDRGEDAPVPTAALNRLRTLRDRLVEREGGGESGAGSGQVDELPVEVVNFFRSEADALLDRIDRMVADLADLTGTRGGTLRRELRDAFTALRDIARTFGFGQAASLAERGLTEVEESGGTGIPALLSELRVTVAGEVPGEPALTPVPQSEPPRVPDDAVAPPSDVTFAQEPAPEPPSAAPEPPRAAPTASHGAATAELGTVPGPRPAGVDGTGEIPQPSGADDGVVEIDSLLYRGDAAFRRALELRPVLEDAISDPAAREALDEVFDLIRLGLE